MSIIEDMTHALPLVVVAEHWEPSSGGYRQSLFMNGSHVNGMRFEYGNAEYCGNDGWHDVEWYEVSDHYALADDELFAFIDGVPSDAYQALEGQYDSAPTVLLHDDMSHIAVQIDGPWRTYTIATVK